MKSIPNFLSLSRILLSMALLLIVPFSPLFYTLYIICGLSDMVDGYIARKLKITSKLGARLDSIADFIMAVVLFIVLIPVINLTKDLILWIIGIGAIRVVSMIVTYKKYRTFAILHTYGNKITGMALFLFPLLLIYVHGIQLAYLLCTIASISALEELLIHLTSHQLELDRQSIIYK